MKLGAYTACLHDRTTAESFDILRDLGLESIEINTGGFLPAPHIHMDALLASPQARHDYLARVAEAGLEITALNVNGNPLHPDVEVGSKHARDLRNTIDLAGKIGVRNVVTMSGQPGAHPGGLAPTWMVEPWNSAISKALAYQWDEVAIPFWKDIEQRARRANVRVCIEMHPHNLVYNPATLTRLIDSVDATNIGAEMDPSHLFWQGIEPITAIEHLADRVFHAAAKDVRINWESTMLNGVLDDRFRTPAEDDPNAVDIGGGYVLNRFPVDPPWQFVALGRGHDADYWANFLGALRKVDPEIAVNIEHEDDELGQLEGVSVAAETLRSAAARLPH